jgi:flagellar protein FliL
MARTPDAKSTDKAASDKDAKPAAKPRPKRGKGLVVIAALLALVGAGGGGAWWWLNRDAGTAQANTPTTRPPVFMNLEPFTVNLLEEGGEHYLQTSIVFQVADEKAVETMKAYLPVIRNRILLLLSSKRPSDLASPGGKAKLVEEVTGAAREAMPGTTPQRGIVQAYLGAFVVQ